MENKIGMRIHLLKANKNFNRKTGCGGYAYPEISPDGQKLCYIFNQKLCIWGAPSLMEEFNIVTKTRRLVAKGDFSDPKYSNDGKWLLFEEINFPESKYWIIDLQTLKNA